MMMTRRNTQGSGLAEAVLALAIVVFDGFALIGLFAAGLENSSDSKQRFQAATLAEALCSPRRAVPPTAAGTSHFELTTTFALP